MVWLIPICFSGIAWQREFRIMWRLIWLASEFTGIGLGRFAPFVFGKMIGREGKRIK
jgi:hypothetical protein